jgi:hypothetical protein
MNERKDSLGCLLSVTTLPLLLMFIYTLPAILGFAVTGKGCTTTNQPAIIEKVWLEKVGFSETSYFVSVDGKAYSITRNEFGTLHEGDWIVADTTICGGVQEFVNITPIRKIEPTGASEK